MASVQAEGLTKRYVIGQRRRKRRIRGLLRRGSVPDNGKQREAREIYALRDVSFELEPGTIMGVIGPNGAGKSTLLKILSRVTLPTSGRALIDGRVVSLLELGGVVSPDLSGRENVFLNAALHGIPRSVALRRMDDIIEFAGLERFIDTAVKRYSSGMYLRLAFSVAVNMEPSVLVADEVLAVGDMEFQERCLERIEKAGHNDGVTVLFVSHDMTAVRGLCDRVMWLNEGEVMAEGDPDDVIDRYEEFAWSKIERYGSDEDEVSDSAELLAIRLVAGDDEHEVGAISVADRAAVQVFFRTKRPDLDCRPVLGFLTEGVPAFRTGAARPFRVADPGTYVATVGVPPNLLDDRSYMVKGGVIVSDGTEEVTLGRRNALRFRVYDVDPEASARGDFTGKLTGAVRPRLDWDLQDARHVRGIEVERRRKSREHEDELADEMGGRAEIDEDDETVF